jgi:hypothetical protein
MMNPAGMFNRPAIYITSYPSHYLQNARLLLQIHGRVDEHPSHQYNAGCTFSLLSI